MNTDRLPPHDPDAERAVLGCVLLDWQAAMPACIQVINTPEIFYDLKHQQIYRVMVEMYDAQEAIDLVTLCSWLTFQALLEQAGGVAYLGKLPDAAPSAANIESYLEILAEKHRCRQLIKLGAETVSGAYDSGDTAQTLIETAASRILGLCDELTPKDEESSIQDLIPIAQAQIESWHAAQGVISGVATGFPDLDKMTTGFHPGDLVVIAGRPSLGKSSLAMNIVDHVAVDQGFPVGVFSLEMTKASLAVRMLCSRAGVNLRYVSNGFVADRDFPKLAAAGAQLHSGKIYINDQAGLSILAVRTRARRMKQQYGIQLLVVDYLQLMNAERNRNDSREREVGLISAGLKGIAKELQIPVIAISQLNRTIERDKERRPRLSDLRESGNIEQDADLVGILWKPKYDEDEDRDAIAVNLEILKQRNGPTGTVPLTFLRCYTRFESAVKVSQQQDQPYQAPYADAQQEFPS